MIASGFELVDPDEQPVDQNALITVCDQCFCASCWQGIFMCSKARNAGTVQKTRAELAALDVEHPSFWYTDDELSQR